MNDGAIAASIIVYLLGLIGLLGYMKDIGYDLEPWSILASLFWPLAIPLSGAAWIAGTMAKRLGVYDWLTDWGQER